MNKLLYKQEPSFIRLGVQSERKINIFSGEYMNFISCAKTERLSVDCIAEELKKAGYPELELYNKTVKNIPQKFFVKFFDKNIAAVNLSGKKISEGVNFILSHIDSPRIDLKQNPLIEMSEMAMLKTHYYGGIKKYQWLNTPLALYGVVFTGTGKKVKIAIGDNEKDPVFIIPDIAPHLSHKIQDGKVIKDAVTGEMLNALAGTTYNRGNLKEKDKLKICVLDALNKKYHIREEDLLTAELQLVPAIKPRFSGFDESLIAGYGHDDRACSFASLKAILDSDSEKITRPAICIFYDKEEIGSEGATGAKSKFIEDILFFIMEYSGVSFQSYHLRKVFLKSNAVSADVNTVINPNFPEPYEKQNCSRLGYGVVLTKFTGSGGKYSANDANSEYVSKISAAFNKKRIPWQIGELGKVDEGGGGTIAKYIAEYGCNIVDLGVGVMSMHSPFEIVSKYDLYSTYLAYKSFLAMR